MRKLFLALLVPLAGCAGVTDILAPAYEPQPIHIYDRAQYVADLAECQEAGIAFKPQFSIATAVTRTVDGATANTSMIPISPLVPAYGAAGGAMSAASDGLDVMSRQHQNVFRNCLREEVRRDGSAIIADPRD